MPNPLQPDAQPPDLSKIQVPQSKSQYSAETMATFQKFLGPSATPEQVKQFIDGLIKQIMNDMKHEQQRAMEAIKKMRRVQEGKEE